MNEKVKFEVPKVDFAKIKCEYIYTEIYLNLDFKFNFSRVGIRVGIRVELRIRVGF